ncbi:MAG: hypothetical protein RI947_1566 [Candidatus Parcubacteria bacterium]|jgi:hypothetical protein
MYNITVHLILTVFACPEGSLYIYSSGIVPCPLYLAEGPISIRPKAGTSPPEASLVLIYKLST